MKKFSVAVFVAFILTGPAALTGQTRDGSIQESWDRAPKEKPSQTQRQQPQFLPGTGDNYSTWDRQRSEQARTWTRPAAPAVTKDYHTSNTQLIDSLAALYCLSANYITTLRQRNESTGSTSAPRPAQRDFAYAVPAPEQKPLPGRESPEALRKELLQLLDQCLYGRY